MLRTLAEVSTLVIGGMVDRTDELLAVRVAELYYDERKTQDEIGALLRKRRTSEQ